MSASAALGAASAQGCTGTSGARARHLTHPRAAGAIPDTPSASSEHFPTAYHVPMTVRKKENQEIPQTARVCWCSDEKIKDISPKSVYSCADTRRSFISSTEKLPAPSSRCPVPPVSDVNVKPVCWVRCCITEVSEGRREDEEHEELHQELALRDLCDAHPHITLAAPSIQPHWGLFAPEQEFILHSTNVSPKCFQTILL